MSTPYEAVVAHYHVEAEDFPEDNDENDGLVSSSYHHHHLRRPHHRGLWAKNKHESQSFAMNAIYSEEDDEGKLIKKGV